MEEKITINPRFAREKVTEKRKMCEIHCHDDYELYYLVDGDTKYFIDNELFHLRKGDFIFIDKGKIHKTDSEDCLHNERVLLGFGDELFEDDMQEVLKELSEARLISISEKHRASVEELVLKIEKEYEDNSPYKEQMIRLYTRTLLISLCRHKIKQRKKHSEDEEFILAIAEFISNNFSEEISLSSLSHRFSVSEGHLSRRFKLVMGVGLNEYIRYVRIQRAAKRLSATKESITEIACACGFNDSNYFSTVFKRIFGMTPCKYRQKRHSD